MKNRTFRPTRSHQQAINCSTRTSDSGLWLYTCYRCLTLSLTTVNSWLAGVISEIVTLQRLKQDWQAPLQCFSSKLESGKVVNFWRLSEETQSPYLDWGNMWVCQTQRQWSKAKGKQDPLQKINNDYFSCRKEWKIFFSADCYIVETR